MKLTQTHSGILACGLSLFVLPIAFANDPEKKLDKLDTNRDGQISRAEHAAGAQRMFSEMDTSRDGVVTATEMDASIHAKHGDKNRDEMSAREKIRMIDQNSDGRLTAAEHSTGSDQMFDKMDTNKDGPLTKDELEAGHKMKKKDKNY
jgi:hypothetical protein